MRLLPYVVLLVLVVFAVTMILRARSSWRLQGPGGITGRPPRLPDELVKDPVCGTYVVRSRAVRGAGTDLCFCSRECARRYAAQTRG